MHPLIYGMWNGQIKLANNPIVLFSLIKLVWLCQFFRNRRSLIQSVKILGQLEVLWTPNWPNGLCCRIQQRTFVIISMTTSLKKTRNFVVHFWMMMKHILIRCSSLYMCISDTVKSFHNTWQELYFPAGVLANQRTHMKPQLIFWPLLF